MGRVEGKVAIVSGAARGLGAAFARGLADEGAHVVIADVLANEGAAVAGELGERACFVPLDVTRVQDWARAVGVARERFGDVTVLVNNAGIRVMHTIKDLTEADYRRVVDVNQLGAVLGMQAVLPSMQAAGGGSIVNVSSVLGVSAAPGRFSYVASKWALRGMTKAAALELAADGIRVNSVHPGIFPTELTRGANVATFGDLPLGRLGELHEAARLVVYLASDESSYTTGAEHVVDGGLTVGFD